MSTRHSNPFPNMSSLRAAYGRHLPQPADNWRTIKEPHFGHIQGIPSMMGLAVATDGIYVVIKRGDGHFLLGHLDWFISDDIPEVGGFTKHVKDEVKPEGKSSKQVKLETDYTNW